MILAWRNDPYIVERSSSKRILAQEEHAGWFPGALQNPSCLMFVILLDGVPAGLSRFDRRDPSSCVITTYLLEPFTGCGQGVLAISESSQEAFKHWEEVNRIVAIVRKENEPGRKGFVRAGFSPASEASESCPPGHVCMVLKRNE
jgi:RimJ/RimL family protein N-acetyltransferase